MRPGELYRAPNDPNMPKFAGNCDHEQSGFLAGCSYGKIGDNNWSSKNKHIPQLEMVAQDDGSNYAWLPLATRVDIDRVYRVVVDSQWFAGVCQVGSHKKQLKQNPWSHMSLYRVQVRRFLEKCPVDIGVTDEGDLYRRSSSGARLYTMGPAHLKVWEMTKGGFGKGWFCEPDFAPETGPELEILDDTLAFKSYVFC